MAKRIDPETYEDLPLAERQRLERAYFLGKTDVDPRTGKTVAEQRKSHIAATEEADADLRERMKSGYDTEVPDRLIAFPYENQITEPLLRTSPPVSTPSSQPATPASPEPEPVADNPQQPANS